jgi:hypothetical protein
LSFPICEGYFTWVARLVSLDAYQLRDSAIEPVVRPRITSVFSHAFSYVKRSSSSSKLSGAYSTRVVKTTLVYFQRIFIPQTNAASLTQNKACRLLGVSRNRTWWYIDIHAKLVTLMAKQQIPDGSQQSHGRRNVWDTQHPAIESALKSKERDCSLCFRNFPDQAHHTPWLQRMHRSCGDPRFSFEARVAAPVSRA